MPYPERIKNARPLLKEAGYGPDKRLKLTLRYNTSENQKCIAVAVASMWKQVGVAADYNNAQNFFYLMETRTGANNYSRYSNPEYDKLMREAELTQIGPDHRVAFHYWDQPLPTTHQ